MLAFAPWSLPDVFQSLITDFPYSIRNGEPANILYLQARFACLTSSHQWLEELVGSAADAIEDVIYVSEVKDRALF